MVRWLHISDLHIVDKADWNNFEKELIKKCREYGKIDLIIVTGDFHNFSDGDDFHLAVDFLRSLLESLDLDMGRDLFVVPGNHDGTDFVQDKNIFIRSAKSKPFEDTERWVEALLPAFQNYESFVKELIPLYPVEHPSSVHSRTWRDQIHFIHCNTALAADGKEKPNQLLDVDTLATANYVPTLPNILLAHNSFFDLHPEHQRRVQDSIRVNSVCAYFCGDRHEQSVDEISIGGDQVPCVVSYKGAPDPMDSYSTFGIILGEWEGELAELKGWCWKSGQGFSEDLTITGKHFPIWAEKAPLPDPQLEGPAAKECSQEIQRGGEIHDTQVKEYTLKRQFAISYYELTYRQCSLFNRKHVDMPLTLQMSSIELYDYVNAAQEKGVLEEMVRDLSSM